MTRSRLLLAIVALALVAPSLHLLFAGAAEAAAFPEKGRPITMIVPWSAGGSLDLSARLLASDMEKILGTPVMVVNKPGASGQVGTTQLALAKPDGYTFGVTAIPSTSTIYLDPDRKAVFGRKELAPLARHVSDPIAIAVRADSKYQTLKDLVADAKANPERVKAGSPGILSAMHLGLLLFQKAADLRFAPVQFDGSGQVATALLGGHIDVMFDVIAVNAPNIKAGKVRILGVMDREPSRQFPEVKTLESQGLKVYLSTSRAYSAPGGTPKEIVEILSAAIKKATEGEAHRKRLEELSLTVAYLDAAQFGAYWDELDAQIKPFIALAKQQ
jgi:tripartite-type tricarboxylate transporter receptor subunit TctC